MTGGVERSSDCRSVSRAGAGAGRPVFAIGNAITAEDAIGGRFVEARHVVFALLDALVHVFVAAVFIVFVAEALIATLADAGATGSGRIVVVVARVVVVVIVVIVVPAGNKQADRQAHRYTQQCKQ